MNLSSLRRILKPSVAALLAGWVFAPVGATSSQKIARDDLARALLSLERAFAAHASELSPERRAETERAFDRATGSFFLGSYASALRDLDELSLSLTPEAGIVRDLLPLQLRGEPSVDPPQVEILATPLYGEPATGWATLILEDGHGNRLAQAEVDLALNRWTLPLPEGQALGQDLHMYLAREGQPAKRFRVRAGSEPFDTGKDVLANLPANPSGALPQTILASRAALLKGRPSPMRSAEFLLSPYAFASELQAEAAAIAADQNPYLGRPGSWWLTLEGIPVRIVAPAGEGPWPLVVAFHGMGGDENMFSQAYGAGYLAQLAEERGFLLVCPSTYSVRRRPEAFARLLKELEKLYDISPERRLLIGHSMGCGVVSLLLQQRAAPWSGAILIAGNAPVIRSEGGKLPLCIQVHGDLDPISSFASAERAVQRLAEQGQPVRFVPLPGRGHTLLVPEAIALGLAAHGWNP